MSMQGMHIFRRDRMTQLIRCIPWSTKLCPHPTIAKKMKTFLEVENKMGPIIPALGSQFRPPLPETNPNIRKGDSTERRKRATSKKKFRPATPRATMMCTPLLQALPKPTDGASSAPVTVREDTLWPSAGKMLGNLFEERNWVLPRDYLVTEDKKGGCYQGKTSSKRRIQNGRANFQQEVRKVWLGTQLSFLYSSKQRWGRSAAEAPT